MATVLLLPALLGLGRVPVRLGLTFPAGAVPEVRVLTLRGARLAAVTPLAWHPDGSVAVAALWAVVDRARRRRVSIHLGPPAEQGQWDPDSLFLRDGRTRASFARGAPSLPVRLVYRGIPCFEAGGFRLSWGREPARWERFCPGPLGPGRSEVRAEGRLGLSPVRLRLIFWGGGPWLEVAGDVDGPPGPGGGELALTWPLPSRRARLRPGERCLPIPAVYTWRNGDGERPVFGQPGAWWSAALVDGALLGETLHLTPGQASLRLRAGPWPPGRRFAFRVFLRLDRRPPRVRARRLLEVMAQGLPAMVPAPQGSCSPLARRTLQRLHGALAAPACRGVDDLGDYRAPRVGWANGEYDALAVLVEGARRTARPEAWAWARRTARHLRTVDRNPESRLPWRHGEDHQGGEDPGHVWLEGFLHYARATGDRAAWTRAREIAQALCDLIATTRARFRRERDYGWTLAALAAAAQAFREKSFRRARDTVGARLLSLRANGFFWIETLAGGRRVRTTTFAVLGIVVPALVAWGRTSTAREVVRRYWAAAWNPERRFLAWTLILDPDRRRPVARQGRVRGADALFVAAGLSAAGLAGPARELFRFGAATFDPEQPGADPSACVRALRSLLPLRPFKGWQDAGENGAARRSLSRPRAGSAPGS